MSEYVTKDSGERIHYPSGMVRDVGSGKPRYDLIPIGPLKRLAELYMRGADKYGDNNWQLADTEEELKRFKGSGLRHFMQAMDGETDEDHWAAVVFNVFAAMWLEDKLRSALVAYESMAPYVEKLALHHGYELAKRDDLF